ncbi:hypothetical protein QFZ87_004236 [Bacillus sp. SLBN-46]|nr:hypothetical protein [Bacillus sp. SLBN-46]
MNLNGVGLILQWKTKLSVESQHKLKKQYVSLRE